MKIARNILLVTIALGFIYLLFWPIPVTPETWYPKESPKLEGVYESNNYLSAAEKLARGVGIGPEDVDVDSQGRIYGSFADGRIMRFAKDGTQSEEFVNTGGRPLGMEFDSEGNLIIADAKKGLLSVSSQGKLTVLATEAEGVAFGFTDDLDVAADGKIYFSDASDKFPIEDYAIDLIEHGPNGRLLVYDPKSQKTTVLLRDLYFANGIAVSPDQSFVLVVETSSYQVKKYWLTGDRQGSSEVIIDNLPGFPDGISSNGKDIFWIAIAYPRDIFLDKFASKPFVRKIFARIPDFIRPIPPNYAFVLGIDGEGSIVYNLQDPSSESFSPVTSVEEVEDTLYLGSLTYDAIARIKVPAL